MEQKPLIPFLGTKQQYSNLREELLDVTDRVYSSGEVLDGLYTQKFEQKIAAICNRRYAIAVNSSTQALIFAQQALFPRDAKIIIPAVSFVDTINSVLMSGNNPILCDVDNQALLDLESIDYALKGSGVSGIMYVNLFGNTIDYDRFNILTNFFNSDLKIIEDASQSFGASYKEQPSGSMGDISILSFNVDSNLNNYGTGGMILTDNLETANTIRDFRDNGKINDHDNCGTESKMSEVECAQLLVKLKYFPQWQRRRKEIAEYYNSELEDYVDIPKTTEYTVNAYNKYVFKTEDRHSVQAHLFTAGIETKIHYSTPLYEYPIGYPYIDYMSDLFREASAFCSDCLSLPIYPELTNAEVESIVETIKNYLN